MGLSGGLSTNGGSLAVAPGLREVVKMNGLGFKGQAYDIQAAAVLSATPGSKVLMFQSVGLVAGDLVSNVCVSVFQAGAGTVPTGIYSALYSAAGSRLAVSANDAANAVYTATGVQACGAFTTPYVVPTTGLYYIAWVEDTTSAWGTTALKIGSVSAVTANETSSATGSSVFLTAQMAGQASPPTSATLATSTVNPWLGWS